MLLSFGIGNLQRSEKKRTGEHSQGTNEKDTGSGLVGGRRGT